MLKYFWLLIILFGIFLKADAQSAEKRKEKEILHKLVQEREDKFGDYARAAAARSGFFGNKTKNDLRRQTETLVEIIKTDNRIIMQLNNFLDFKTFERTEYTYTQAQQDEKIKKLTSLTDNLAKDLAQANRNNKNLRLRLRFSTLFNYLTGFGMVWVGIWYWRKRKQEKEEDEENF
jgi:hypothetical protein